MTKVEKKASKSGEVPPISTGPEFRHWKNDFKAACIVHKKCYLVLRREDHLNVRELALYQSLLRPRGEETKASYRSISQGPAAQN